ncbi:diketo-D-gluconic acid reductase [Seminavis robusta]|uniref:Diketo-D-gluconic acid reductase n=1 Tax=Seminavis robusta TaxID=568900 RepID=A0A9N8HXS1_9STRA|nr:diketo-D-gluconic acid reductase [Seminavis robusta]|eukprot:Sro1856_g302000.1 diketo-D-gluconic acid reductase (489) ;mRNA; r:11897-13363
MLLWKKIYCICILLSSSVPLHYALTPTSISRREALTSSAVSLAGLVVSAPPGVADETVDLDAIKAARANGPTNLLDVVNANSNNKNKVAVETVDMDKVNAARQSKNVVVNSIVPIKDPPPILAIGSTSVKIPRVGYSFYKTAPDQAARCTTLALYAGIRHLDVATDYGSNAEVARALQKYLDIGPSGLLNLSEEKPELLEQLEATRLAGEKHALQVGASSQSFTATPTGSIGRKFRRDRLFLSHKVSNQEQSTDPVAVRRSVKATIKELGCQYLDMVSIHTPLTDKARRLATYEALLDLRDSGFCKAVGVCNYGLGPLQEIEAAKLELPAVNQLELSPFNQHKEVVSWCNKNGIAIACGAWSKLSSADGPTDQWEVVGKMAQQKGMTKAQVLVRWSMQKGYICVPRSAATSKVERVAIAENSYGGVNLDESNMLTAEEMQILEGLDVSLKCGKLGRRDGWTDEDVTSPDWEPTDFDSGSVGRLQRPLV